MLHTLETKKLSFGSQISFIDVPGDPMLNFDIYIKGGYQFSPKDKYDVPHVLEHCLFEKNKHFKDPKGLKFAIERLGAYNNGSTSITLNQYSMQGAADKCEDIITLLLELVHDTILDEGIFRQELEVVRNELLLAKNDYKRELSTTMLSYMKKGVLNYKQRLAILDNIEFSDIIKLYDESYGSANCSFIISGGIGGNEQSIMQIIESFYAERNMGKERIIDYSISDGYPQKTVFIEAKDKTNYDFSIRFITEDKTADLRDYLAFPIGLFMDGMGSRIQLKAREAGLVYTLQGSCFSERDYISLGFSESIPGKKIIPLLKMIIDELRDIFSGNVSDEEIERAKGYIYGFFVRNHVNGSNLSDFYEDMLIHGDPFIGFNEYLELIRSFKREDLKIFKEKMDFSRWIFGIIGKDAESKSEEVQDFLKEYLS